MNGNQQQLLSRHRAVLPSWLALYYDEPIELVRGQGRHVWDGDGTRYLDLFGGILTTMTGHAVPEVIEAIREQAGRMLHTSTVYLIRPMVELAERLVELAPMPDAKVFFVCSGTEANEAAVLMTTTARRSNQVLALRNSYHGRSFGAMGLTGNRGWRASSLSPLQVSFVPNGDRLRGPFAGLEDAAFVEAATDELRTVIETTTSGDVACMLAEPIQGVGGFIVPPDGLFAAFKRVLDEYGIPFVSDEVQTGWGRTGEHFWGIQAHDVVPDAVTFAKGLGNGMALAGVIARGDLAEAVPANSISTFGGNPLSTTAALANLEHLLSNDLQHNAKVVGAHLLDGLRQLAQRSPIVAEVRGRGLMIGIELVRRGGLEPAPQAASALLQAAKDAGVLVGKGGLYGNVIRIAPPLSITLDEADEALQAIAQALAEVEEAGA
ncbi:MAG TPA: aspartate aminotransferase family protein [Nitriliruptorales bacterium]